MDTLYILAKEDLTTLDIMSVHDYSITWDSEFDGKSTVEVMRKPNYEEGDYCFIKDDSTIIFQGIIDSVDNSSGTDEHTINLLEIEHIFDEKIILGDSDLISSTGIEDFIKSEIEDNFINSNDDMMNLTYMNVVAETHTKIYASVDVDDGDIYNLLTYIGNAREYYGIFIDWSFEGQTLTLTISKKEQNTLKFDSSLSEIRNYEETYSVDALSKLTCVWKIPDTEDDDGNTIVGATTFLQRFLRTDRTITDDITDSERAKGTSNVIYVECDTEDEAIQEMQNEFTSNSYSHKVVADVKRNSLIYLESEFYVGHECTIKTQSHGIKDSIISEKSIEKNKEYMTITFGNMAITLIDKLRKERTK